ncbi:hypothetical protein K788_00003355 [Paraburkholderia caribensis MBA4]|uniref:Uncharacterized protein n=2 Tax=Paraburkholderia caribensis TaxID=75105 RepID=A0A0P0RIA6_9BURK|nr:hypothetical protein K788_00003355 [Paraburkholderia caribensis MBA4]
MIEKLINDKTAALLSELDDEERQRFFEQRMLQEEG